MTNTDSSKFDIYNNIEYLSAYNDAINFEKSDIGLYYKEHFCLKSCNKKCSQNTIKKAYEDISPFISNSLEEILDNGHLDRVFTDTWTKPSCVQGKMAYCANICGTYSRVDRIYTHDKMDDKSRNWRLEKK
jgi:hypothetical protein